MNKRMCDLAIRWSNDEGLKRNATRIVRRAARNIVMNTPDGVSLPSWATAKHKLDPAALATIEIAEVLGMRFTEEFEQQMLSEDIPSTVS